MKKTAIIGINIFVIAVLLSVFIYPLKPEINLKQKEVTLKWFAIYKNYTIYIDDNKEFTSPIEIKTEMKTYPLTLEPGTYYYKIKAGKISTPIMRLDMESGVSIKLTNDTLENDGNTDLSISLETPTGAVILDLPYKEKLELKENNYNITAKQK